MAITTRAEDDRLLTEGQAADLLRLSSRTLQAWRSRNVGPPFVRAGRAIRYRRSDLNSWAIGNTVVPQEFRSAELAADEHDARPSSPLARFQGVAPSAGRAT